MGISVGALNVLINIGILVLAALAEQVLSRAIGNYSHVELFSRGKAKVVHDSDTKIWYFPVSLLKYRNNLGIFLAIVTAFALVAAEILSEFGVESSRTCGPEWVYTSSGICARDFKDKATDGEIAGVSLYNQRLPWVDQHPIEEFYEGFAKSYDGTQCTSCGGQDKPALVAGCSVTRIITSSSEENIVAIERNSGAFGTVAARFTVGEDVLMGAGDLTCNGGEDQDDASCSLFVVTNQTLDGRIRGVNEIYLATYYNEEHIRDLLSGNESEARANGPITIDSIRCETNAVRDGRFVRAVQIYHTMQLEQSGTRFPRDAHLDGPQPMSSRDIVLAVFGAKVVDEEECEGYTAQFSECGVYNPIFLIPLSVAIASTILLIAVSHYLLKDSAKYNVPRSSRTWYAFIKYLRVSGNPLAESVGRVSEGETYRDWFHPRSYFRGLDDAILLDLRRRSSNSRGSPGEQDMGIEFGPYSSVRAPKGPWRLWIQAIWDRFIQRTFGDGVPATDGSLSSSANRSENSRNWNSLDVPL